MSKFIKFLIKFCSKKIQHSQFFIIEQNIMKVDTYIRERQYTDISNYTSTPCEVKTKYLGKWDKRILFVSLEENLLQLTSSSGRKKSYPLDKVHYETAQNNQEISLDVPGGRKYEIKANHQVQLTLHEIQYFQTSQHLLLTVYQLPTPIPKKLNYFATVRSLSYQEDYIPEHKSTIFLSKHDLNQVEVINIKEYQRLPAYLKPSDWRRDPKKGGIVFINEQKKSIISKMIKYVVSRVLSTGSFMGISFPTFGMKPETILQTYCKCLGAAPLLLDNCSNNPLDRIKAFNALIQTISYLFNDVEKSFNPAIGETFQGQIGGYPVYAEQISHHPPITAFFMDGKNYVLHGSLELNANLGLNSAVGLFYGEVVLEFDDGGVVKGRMPSGNLSGIVFGQTRFGPQGAVYSYDPINHLVSSYEAREKDTLIGYIGKLKSKNYQKFMHMIDSKSKQKYEKFKNLAQKQFQKIHCKIEILWTEHILYDNQVYFDFKASQNLPIKLTQDIYDIGEQLLPSDSSYRADVKLRADLKMQQSQNEKETLQEQQRRLRKLREKHMGIAHRASIG